MTRAEKKLWYALRSRRIGGFKFRRQHPFGPYTLDYFCHELLVDLEIDGPSHIYRTEEDLERDAYMAKHGIITLRFNPSITDDDFYYFLMWFEDWCVSRQQELEGAAEDKSTEA